MKLIKDLLFKGSVETKKNDLIKINFKNIIQFFHGYLIWLLVILSFVNFVIN